MIHKFASRVVARAAKACEERFLNMCTNLGFLCAPMDAYNMFVPCVFRPLISGVKSSGLLSASACTCRKFLFTMHAEPVIDIGDHRNRCENPVGNASL